MSTAVEQWRRDPERREAWRIKLEKRARAFKSALTMLETAIVEMEAEAPRPSSPDGQIYRHSLDALYDARNRMQRAEKFVVEPPTETFLGNTAAFAEMTDGWPE